MVQRDLLDRYGRNVGKRWFSGIPLEQALTFAIHDFKANWRRYRRDCVNREGIDDADDAAE